MEKDRRAVHGLIQAFEKKTEELSTLFRGEPSPNKSGTPRTVEANPSGQQRFAKALHARFTPFAPLPTPFVMVMKIPSHPEKHGIFRCVHTSELRPRS